MKNLKINNRLADGSPRRGEVWVNGWGIFYSGLYGVETPSGRAFYFPSPFTRVRLRKLRKAAASRNKN